MKFMHLLRYRPRVCVSHTLRPLASHLHKIDEFKDAEEIRIEIDNLGGEGLNLRHQKGI
jgi:hypothetical protein